MFVRNFTAAFAMVVLFWVSDASGAQLGIGLQDLRDLVGKNNVSGSGVNLLHVEAGTPVLDVDDVDMDGDTEEEIGRKYTPNPARFVAVKSFVDAGSSGSLGNDGHSASVGVQIYGLSGVAPRIGITDSSPIVLQSTNGWINSELSNGGGTPTAQNYDVSNHSYIFRLDESEGFDRTAAENVLQRLDYAINEGNMTTVAGTANPLPAGLVQAYNTVNVGLTDGSRNSGLSTLNGEGRNIVHVVVNKSTTSAATAVVSGSAAILHQTGRDTDAIKQEVIKATLLAGATKEEFNGVWSHTSEQPLDPTFGAGELNVFNSYLIQQAGEIDGAALTPVGTTDFNGWDYEEELLIGDDRLYEFSVGAGNVLEELSIALTWNLDVIDGTPLQEETFTPITQLANLSLELFDSSGDLIEFSDSDIDNVEHLYLQNLGEGTYQLRVANRLTGSFNTDFGLAFRSNAIAAVPEPAGASIISLALASLLMRRRKR